MTMEAVQWQRTDVIILGMIVIGLIWVVMDRTLFTVDRAPHRRTLGICCNADEPDALAADTATRIVTQGTPLAMRCSVVIASLVRCCVGACAAFEASRASRVADRSPIRLDRAVPRRRPARRRVAARRRPHRAGARPADRRRGEARRRRQHRRPSRWRRARPTATRGSPRARRRRSSRACGRRRCATTRCAISRPVAFIGTSPFLFVVPASLPVNSLEEFVAYAKAQPGELSYAGSARGTVVHLATEMFKHDAGIDDGDDQLSRASRAQSPTSSPGACSS